MPMLLHAIPIPPDSTHIQKISQIAEEDILDVNLGLVVVDKESRNVHFVHNTTIEYLQKEHIRVQYFPNAQEELATTCIVYLSLDVFGTNDAEMSNDLEEEYPRYPYASRCRAIHTKGKPEASLQKFILKFLTDNKKFRQTVSYVFQDLFTIQPFKTANNGHKTAHLYKYNHPFTNHIDGTHLAAFFGL